MRLVASAIKQGRALIRPITFSVALAGIWVLAFSSLQPTAWAANPVSYIISPVSSSLQPNSTIDISLTMRTDIAIAGAAVHLAFTNGSYAGFESSGASGISFVDYHTVQNDIVFICSNNNCPAGTYEIATITVKSGASGDLKVDFVPRETADAQLNLLSADGTSGSYSITASAPASPSSKQSQNKFTVPQDDGSGNMAPLVVTDEQLINKLAQAQEANEQTSVTTSTSTTPWTAKNLVFMGLGFGAGLGILLFLLLQVFGAGPRPRGPSGGVGPGPTVSTM